MQMNMQVERFSRLLFSVIHAAIAKREIGVLHITGAFTIELIAVGVEMALLSSASWYSSGNANAFARILMRGTNEREP